MEIVWRSRGGRALPRTCCCPKIEIGRSMVRNRPLSWVGDTGTEPVTSSV